MMAMLVTLGVMNGFEADLKEKLLGNMAPVTVTGRGLREDVVLELRERLGKREGLLGFSPYVRCQVLLADAGRPVGATLVGIDPERLPVVSRLPEQLVEGSLGSLEGTAAGEDLPEACRDKPSILLGRELSDLLGAYYGDLIRVVSPEGIETPFGIVPAQKTFCVGGVFRTGLYEYDASFAYVALDEAQTFLRLGDGISGVDVGIADYDRAREWSREIRRLFPGRFRVEDWMEKNRRLLAAMRLEKVTAFSVLALIVLVAALSILSSLAMTVTEKRKEIAILKAMGADRRRIQALFVLQGLLVGASGTAVGTAAGLAICKLLERYPVVRLPRDIFYQFTLPVRTEWLDVLLVSSAALLLSLLATLFPAWKAARLPPAETLRYE